MVPTWFAPVSLAALLLCGFNSTTTVGQTASQADSSTSNALPAKVVQMLNTQVSWDSGLGKPPRQRLRFVRIEDPARQVANLTRYRVYADGAREGTQFVFAIWKIGTYVENMQVFSAPAYVNRKGLLLTHMPSVEEEDRDTVDEKSEYDIGIQAANGEPLRFVLHTKDNKFIEPGTLVPFPIRSVDKNCSLEARLASPEGQAILFYADGFPPNSELVAHGDSAGKLNESRHTTDGTGHVSFMQLPYVLGKESGILKVVITSSECTVSAEIPWGKGSYKKH